MKRAWLPMLCVVIQFVSVSTGPSHHRSPLILGVAALAAVSAGAALLFRERAPFVVLAATVLAYVVQILCGAPVIPAAVAVSLEVCARRAAVQRQSQARTTVALVAGLIGVAGSVAIAGAAFLAAPFGVLLLGAALLGTLRASRAEHEAGLRRELVVAERLRIARDLHDVVGHGVGAIAVQAGAARMAIAAGARPEATQALLTIESAGRAVLTEVRWLVGLLRDDTERPALADIPALVGNARRSGLDVELIIEGDVGSASPDTGEAAYRIVQEALTNVLRHSGVSSATVRIRVGAEVHIEVVDRGPAALGDDRLTEGNGVRGMRERVDAVGGSVHIGPDVSGGWSVRAILALRARAR